MTYQGLVDRRLVSLIHGGPLSLYTTTRTHGRKARTVGAAALLQIPFLLFLFHFQFSGCCRALHSHWMHSFRHEVTMQLRAVKVDRNEDSRGETLPYPH